MKKVFFICFALGISTFGKLFAASEDTLASFHFIGANTLTNNPNAARLRKIWALPESANFRNDVLEKLALASSKALTGDSSTNRAASLQPLFNDLLLVESIGEFHGNVSAPDVRLAVRLDDARSRVWETNLLKTLQSKAQTVKLEDASGWEIKLSSGRSLKLVRAGKWTFVFEGNEPAAAQSAFLNGIKNSSLADSKKDWLEANVDWPKLQSILPEGFPLKLARTELKISGRGGEDLRTSVRVIYPEKLNWKSTRWEVPKTIIRDPLISFTAAQDVSPFFKPLKDFQQLSVNPLNNQFFFWAMSQMPFQWYFAMPAKNATNTAKALVPQLAANFNDDLKKREAGTLLVASNHVDLHWRGLPIIVPFFGPSNPTNASDFLVGGIFPLVPSTNSAPAELFKQIEGRNDVVFYDWEITQARLGQWQMLSQMLPFFSKEVIVSQKDPSKKTMVPSRAPEQKWISAVAPLLGNTVTEITFKAPNELDVVRKSHIGLNSFELVMLSHWLAHPKFPAVNPFSATPSVERVLPTPPAKR
jgi:hypothetical protein